MGQGQPAVSPENFQRIEQLALNHLSSRDELFRFDGYAGADPDYD
jgi:ATP-dependent phosphoenolpyruvate carboxykinase